MNLSNKMQILACVIRARALAIQLNLDEPLTQNANFGVRHTSLLKSMLSKASLAGPWKHENV